MTINTMETRNADAQHQPPRLRSLGKRGPGLWGTAALASRDFPRYSITDPISCPNRSRDLATGPCLRGGPSELQRALLALPGGHCRMRQHDRRAERGPLGARKGNA